MKIVRDWMGDLSLACQGVLMCAMRGPDESGKETSAKQITRGLRAVCLNGAHAKGTTDFMGDHSGVIDERVLEAFAEDHDEYPHHWLMHMVHAVEIIGYLHPDDDTRVRYLLFYQRMVKAFHMLPESREQLVQRLRERNPPHENQQLCRTCGKPDHLYGNFPKDGHLFDTAIHGPFTDRGDEQHYLFHAEAHAGAPTFQPGEPIGPDSFGGEDGRHSPAAATLRAKRCPTCDSKHPEMHPAMQADGGEVQICPNPWHQQ